VELVGVVEVVEALEVLHQLVEAVEQVGAMVLMLVLLSVDLIHTLNTEIPDVLAHLDQVLQMQDQPEVVLVVGLVVTVQIPMELLNHSQ
jgi:hypothetical protein